MGSSTTNSCYGATINPWSPPSGRKLCAGGSSGGAAASVASGAVDGYITKFLNICVFLSV
jgi:Asp-tRNA(Asn)/Glu-tRNA(Gln) amidotransferase A subunit family amidase